MIFNYNANCSNGFIAAIRADMFGTCYNQYYILNNTKHERLRVALVNVKTVTYESVICLNYTHTHKLFLEKGQLELL